MFVYILVVYLLWNAFAFCLMGFDKRRAVKGGRRVPEKVLLLVSFLLGGLGILLGAVFWHHKTRKAKFIIGIPISLLVNCLIIIMVFNFLVVDGSRSGLVFACEGGDEISSAALDEIRAMEPECALVLGCSVYSDGTPTPMLRDRLDVGIRLYKEGVVPKLLLSGDHGQVEYNEIGSMYSYCLAAGIPEEDIFLDHAGFSTYDSMYRAQSIFCVQRCVVVTQTYHEFRAIHIGNALGIRCLGVASDQEHYRGAVYRETREVLARFKDYFKVMLKLPPTYGGEEIPITGPADRSHD